jgi:hypothetical protein
VILYLHGGGYVACSAATHRPITAALARLTNRRVFALDYPLAPEHRFPQHSIIQSPPIAGYSNRKDCPRATFLLQAIRLAADLCSALFCVRETVGCRFHRAPSAFSLTDLAGTGASVSSNDDRCQMFRTENIAEFAAAYLGNASPRDPYASPVFADLGGLPIFLQVSSNEILLDDSRRVDDKVREAGGISKLEIYEDLFHCWQMLDGIVPEARTAYNKRRHSFAAMLYQRITLRPRLQAFLAACKILMVVAKKRVVVFILQNFR